MKPWTPVMKGAKSWCFPTLTSILELDLCARLCLQPQLPIVCPFHSLHSPFCQPLGIPVGKGNRQNPLILARQFPPSLGDSFDYLVLTKGI